ncbi:MAG TPA: glycerol-3-phosphate dehydrogenase/oxidase, partial [Planctomycetota bacterium]|nr:glycerol-3-phosphate dehydrogenase/oxidase [Planctomycetota bacterium]
MDLSPAGRARGLPASLTAELLVVGGGITGLGVALDAASRGLATVLVEKGDFAGGTSSRTTKLIHGGLRYLRQGRVGLVRQAARERGRLSRLAPHLVREMPFLLPATGRLHRLSLSMGTRLYDLLGGFHGSSREAVSAARLREWIPEIAERFPQGGVVYHDAWADDCRLCVHVLRKAVDLGARAINYAELVAPLRENGRIAGARVRDRLDGREIDIRARKVVAAVGAWTNELLQRLDEFDHPVVRPTKGAHIVVPRSSLRLPIAAAMPSRLDGRLLFAIPHGADHVLVGTTDTDYDGPLDAPRASAGDVGYLQDRVVAALGLRLGNADVRSCFAGVRPLLLGGPAAPSSVSREHAILERPSGLLLVAGGKLTTFRVMAEEAVDRLYP